MPELASFQQDFVARLDAPHQPVAMLVYRNTVLLGAVDALADNYPVTRAIVGERGFERLAVSHAQRHPPLSPVLADYGVLFPAWLANQRIARDLPYLADVAHCERMWLEALHAADASALELSSLENVDASSLLGLRLAVHPAARFAWLATPAMEIWLAHQDETIGEIAPDWHPGGALFTRPALQVEGGEVDAPTQRMLAGLRLGETLGQAAAAAQQFHPFADVGASLAHLVQRGAFAAMAH